MARKRIGRAALVWSGDAGNAAAASNVRKEHFEGIRRIQIRVFGKLQTISVLDAKSYREQGFALYITKGSEVIKL